MWFQSVLNSLEFVPARTRARRARRSAPRKRPATGKLLLELLEDRTVPSFLPAVSYSLPSYSYASPVAVADFNLDGKPDLVTVSTAGTVSVRLGNGNGIFQAAREFPIGSDSSSVATGDFNGDGKPDIETADSVFLGNGDGTFQPARNFTLPGQFPPGYLGSTPLPQSPISVAVGDFNKDGKLDLAVTGSTFYPTSYGYYHAYGQTNDYVNVLLGNGDGTFTPASTTPLSSTYSLSVALGDFNGDGKLDVVTANNDIGSVSVLLGNGDGTLQAPTNFATDRGPRSVAVGDFNGDGKPDLVTASDAGTVSVLLNNGNGTFGAAQNYGVSGAITLAVAVGDFNKDGNLDLVTTNNYDVNGNVSVLLGNGNGTFQPAMHYAAGRSLQQVAVGDFNRDGWADLAVTGAYDTLSILVNAAAWPLTALQASSFAVSDFPSPTTAGVAGTFTVTAKKADGTTAINYTGTVHFTSDDYKAALPADYTFTAADNGMHTFSATLKIAGTQSISARDTIYWGLSGSQAGIIVNPAAVMGLHMSNPGFNMYVNESSTTTVDAVDAYGNTVTSYTGTVRFTSSDPLARVWSPLPLPAEYTFTTANKGRQSFSFSLATVGTQSFTVTDTVNPELTGTIGLAVSYRATPPSTAPATTLVVGGFRSPTTAGVEGDFYITAWDAKFHIASNYTGTVHFTSSDLQALLPTDYTFTVADQGTHSFGVTLKTAGTQSITVTDTVTASLTGTQAGIVINPAPSGTTPQASSFVVSGFPSPTTAGTAGAFTVTAENAGGTTATGYTGTVHFTSTDGQAGLPADYTFTAADVGVHAFSATLKTAGTQSLTATDATSASLTGSEAGITVNPATASQLAVSAPAGSTAGSAFSVTLTPRDPYNNTATGYTGAVHFASTDGQAGLPSDYTFTAADAGMHTFTNGVILKSAGSQTVTASDTVTSSITGTSAVTVSPAAASTMTVAGFPSPTTAGAAGSLTVTLKDSYGNLASGYAGTVTFTSSDGKASLPANYTFTAADAGVHTFTATLKTAGTQSIAVADTTTASLTGTDGGITVKPGAASRFLIRSTSSVSAGVPFSLTITVQDAYGNVVTGYTGTIHFKSSDGTASLPANYTFTAVDKGVHTFSGLVLRKRGTQKITLTDTLNSSLTGSVIENVV